MQKDGEGFGKRAEFIRTIVGKAGESRLAAISDEQGGQAYGWRTWAGWFMYC